MDKKQILASLALLVGAMPAIAQTGGMRPPQMNSNVDLRTLEIMKEEGISYEEFNAKMQSADLGNYSNHSISSSNYSNHSISEGNYSNHSISAANYSNHSISAGTYSNHSISGRLVDAKGSAAMPSPINNMITVETEGK